MRTKFLFDHHFFWLAEWVGVSGQRDAFNARVQQAPQCFPPRAFLKIESTPPLGLTEQPDKNLPQVLVRLLGSSPSMGQGPVLTIDAHELIQAQKRGRWEGGASQPALCLFGPRGLGSLPLLPLGVPKKGPAAASFCRRARHRVQRAQPPAGTFFVPTYRDTFVVCTMVGMHRDVGVILHYKCKLAWLVGWSIV